MIAEAREQTVPRALAVLRPNGIDPTGVHLWTASFRTLGPQFGTFCSLLSHDERRSAERYRHPDDCRRFILGRGQLRKLLEAYTGVPAQDLVFAYGPFGKPSLEPRPSIPNLQFSLSHTSDVIVYLFALQYGVGIDIEHNPPPSDFLHAAPLFLSLEETRHAREARDERRAELCLRYWTRKEACLKALGTGFSLTPNQIDVSTTPFVRITAKLSPGSAAWETMLYVSDFRIGEACQGAIAAETNVIPKIVRHDLLE
jgi:4'-phosphopantetheinyl transferase